MEGELHVQQSMEGRLMPPQDLDDRYLEGVWYDSMSGDFCKLRRGDSRHVEMVNPGTSEVYHEIAYDDWDGADFYRVPDEAIEDPVSYIEDNPQSTDPNHFDPGYLFADKNTKLVETEDRSWHT